MTKEEGIGLYTRLCAAYGRKYDEAQAVSYFEYLNKFDYGEVKHAIDTAILSPGQFMPSIGDLVDLINPPDAGHAWTNVFRCAQGGCRSWQKLTDTEIATVNAIGGMRLIQDSTDEGLPFLANNFNRTYPVMVKRKIVYATDDERLKDLNMNPETYLFIKKSRETKEIGTGKQEKPAELKNMLAKIGRQI